MANASDEDDEEGEAHHLSKLTTPMRRTTMVPDRHHPQRIVLVERERMKPSDDLEAWFSVGLVKEVRERTSKSPKKIYVTGGRPLPTGYTGCDEHTTLIKANNDIVIWPIRVSLFKHEPGTKKPWTLYHYTHKASFEEFHRIFHSIGTLEPEEAMLEVVKQMQSDYHERVPNPTSMNAKGEPQLTTMEPTSFASKTENLRLIFGKDPTGYSRKGNRYDECADYCIAIEAPHAACFKLSNQSSVCNVRVCRDTLEMFHRRAREHELDEERRKQKHDILHAHDAEHHKDEDKAAVSCWGRLCGFGKPDKPEFWDDEVPDKGRKKEKDMDRWKQRMAKKWLEEHVNDCAQHAAMEHKKRDQAEREAQEAKIRQEEMKHAQKSANTMQVNRKESGPRLNFGITTTIENTVKKYTPNKAARKEEARYRSEANKEVLAGSSLFTAFSKQRSNVSEDNEAPVAHEHMKTMWRAAEQQDEKKVVPTGTKRRVIDRNEKARSSVTDMLQRRGSMASLNQEDFADLMEMEKELIHQKDKEERKAQRRASKASAATSGSKDTGKKSSKSSRSEATEQGEEGAQEVKKKATIKSPTGTPPGTPKSEIPDAGDGKATEAADTGSASQKNAGDETHEGGEKQASKDADETEKTEAEEAAEPAEAGKEEHKEEPSQGNAHDDVSEEASQSSKSEAAEATSESEKEK